MQIFFPYFLFIKGIFSKISLMHLKINADLGFWYYACSACSLPFWIACLSLADLASWTADRGTKMVYYIYVPCNGTHK